MMFCIKVEPQLKYDRMSNDLTTILSRDAASCLAVHSKVSYHFLYVHCSLLKICIFFISDVTAQYKCDISVLLFFFFLLLLLLLLLCRHQF